MDLIDKRERMDFKIAELAIWLIFIWGILRLLRKRKRQNLKERK